MSAMYIKLRGSPKYRLARACNTHCISEVIQYTVIPDRWANITEAGLVPLVTSAILITMLKALIISSKCVCSTVYKLLPPIVPFAVTVVKAR